jgi:hypothetical protein
VWHYAEDTMKKKKKKKKASAFMELKVKKVNKEGLCGLIQYLPSKCEVLSSSPSIAKKEKIKSRGAAAVA